MSATPVPQRVPTLTEVVQDVPVAPPTTAVPPRVEADIASDPLLAAALIQEARIAEEVLASLQPRIDLLFEHRLRDALAPLLTRVYAALAQEMRVEVAAALRDVVAQVVADQVARHRNG
jgi:hypothetical protein